MPAITFRAGRDLIDGGLAAGAPLVAAYNRTRYHPPRDAFDRVDLIRLADDDDAVDAPRVDDRVEPTVIARNHPRQQQVIAAFGDGIGDGSEQTHEKRIGQMLFCLVTQWQDDADRPRALQPEVARGLIDLKAVTFRQINDPPPGRPGSISPPPAQTPSSPPGHQARHTAETHTHSAPALDGKDEKGTQPKQLLKRIGVSSEPLPSRSSCFSL